MSILETTIKQKTIISRYLTMPCMAGAEGFEPSTYGFGVLRSSHNFNNLTVNVPQKTCGHSGNLWPNCKPFPSVFSHSYDGV